MDQANRRIRELDNMLRDVLRAFRGRVGADTTRRIIERVFSTFDDRDEDDAPDALVGARLRPRHPLGSSAIALPEPDEDPTPDVVGYHRR